LKNWVGCIGIAAGVVGSAVERIVMAGKLVAGVKIAVLRVVH
jgi:hypothetical protein